MKPYILILFLGARETYRKECMRTAPFWTPATLTNIAGRVVWQTGAGLRTLASWRWTAVAVTSLRSRLGILKPPRGRAAAS
jgi:hypothetical protein